MGVFVFIPARLKSTRLSEKPLKLIGGKPLIQWVYEGCLDSLKADRVFIATDSEKIQMIANGFGAEVVLTSPEHKSGTDRIAEACEKVNCGDNDIIVNVQGDEPQVTGELIDILAECLVSDSGADMVTLAYEKRDLQSFIDPNVVKVVMDSEGYALYFSRSPVPYFRDFMGYRNLPNPLRNGNLQFPFWKHLGFYAYKFGFLKKFVKLPQGALEKAEKLEQLRALEHGYRIRVVSSPFDTKGIDTKQDLEEFERAILQSKSV